MRGFLLKRPLEIISKKETNLFVTLKQMKSGLRELSSFKIRRKILLLILASNCSLTKAFQHLNKMMQKLVYCIWNKLCSEDDSFMRHTIYALSDFNFELSEETMNGIK